MAGYRHELKYYVSAADALLLSRRLSFTMDSDKHALRANNVSAAGEYHIRSLYFDDLEDAAFHDKIDGVDSRDKYRLRIYDLSDSVIKLERKHKQGQGYIKKESVSVSRGECNRLMFGDPSFLIEKSPLRQSEEDMRFATELYTFFAGGRFRPRVIVDYVREPYVFPAEDVRVTIDKDIRTAYYSKNMFDKYLPTIPVLEPGMVVVEVKFNEWLSEYVRMLIQVGPANRSAVSKYVLCRQFEL